jgi:hypothetical protein
MKTNREKELDDLFSQGMESPGRIADFRESDWDAMEALLDEKKKRGIIYFLPVITGIAAMLVLAMGWFLIIHNAGKQNIAKTSIKKQPTQNVNGGSVKNIDTVSEQQTALQQSALKVKGSGVSSGDRVSAKNGASGMLAAHAAITKGVQNISGRQASKVKGAVNHSYYNLQIVSNSYHNTPALSVPDMLAANNPQLAISNKNYDLSSPSLSPASNTPEIISPVKGNKIARQNNPKRPQLAITVMASPDINGVGSFQNTMVGTNAGLLFSVGVSKRFTVSTGVMYSKKPYLTNFADYHTNYKFKTNPENVTADCRVLDIPINIDYQIYKHARNTFSLGTGISSYIMLRENYHYNYEYPGTAGPTDYNIANKNKHLLGVLNLEATYQHQINSKFAVGVQPYLKVPLTNIGYSQVKLQSAGLAVGVTWNINNTRK